MSRTQAATCQRDEFLAGLDGALSLAGEEHAEATPLDVETRFGLTRVTSWGAPDAAPVVLLPGHGATSASWTAVARRLAGSHRVLAVELVGDVAHCAARSSDPSARARAGAAARTTADLLRWLDDVLAAVAPAGPVVLGGHSYGAWLALVYALARPDAVSRLVLVDPTDCFARPSVRYLVRALPLLARPTPRRWRAFVRWEARDVALDDAWLHVAALGAGLPADRVVRPRRPSAGQLERLSCPTLVLLAARSRAHDPRRVAERACRVPAVTVEWLATCHHSVPAAQVEELSTAVARFMARECERGDAAA